MKISVITKVISAVLCTAILSLSLETFSFAADGTVVSAATVDDPAPFDLDCASAVLMDYATGTVLYNKNGGEAYPPASVTKIMTLLLVMEAIDSGKLSYADKLQASEYASSMGGSQIYLEPGEEMTVEDLIKSVVISSANDAAVTLAEAVAGSETAFINLMNEKAKYLGMNSTNFENATGLDDTTVNHKTSALDIAIMSRELMKHEDILKYSSIWMDKIRGGEFGLTNTNRLVRFYKGATGLKTGSTSKAKFCISATACRDGLHLIAVIMGAPTRDVRNEAAKKLLDYGFANYSLYIGQAGDGGAVRVTGGVEPYISTSYPSFTALLGKGEAASVVTKIELDEKVTAPVAKGQIVGKVKFICGDREIGSVDVTSCEAVDKVSFSWLLGKIFRAFSFS